jgi:hypothetical protein
MPGVVHEVVEMAVGTENRAGAMIGSFRLGMKTETAQRT